MRLKIHFLLCDKRYSGFHVLYAQMCFPSKIEALNKPRTTYLSENICFRSLLSSQTSQKKF